MNTPELTGTIPKPFTRKQVQAMTVQQLRSHAPGSTLMAKTLHKLATDYQQESAWIRKELEKRLKTTCASL